MQMMLLLKAKLMQLPKIRRSYQNLAPLTEKPVLKFVNTDKKVLDKEVVAKYSLENPTKTKIKSITATLKKMDKLLRL